MRNLEIKTVLQKYWWLSKERGHLLKMVPRLKAELGSGEEAKKLYKRYDDIIQNITNECNEIESLISSLDPTWKKIATMRYIEGKDWENIEYEVGYSLSQLFRINNKIVEEIEESEHKQRPEEGQ